MTVEQTGMTSVSNETLMKYFQTPDLGDLVDPAVVIDAHDRILLWHLPGILNGRLVCIHIHSLTCLFLIACTQHDLETATKLVQRLLCETIDMPAKPDTIWHRDPKYFKFPTGRGKFEPGSLDLSPGWFQQRKEVISFCAP